MLVFDLRWLVFISLIVLIAVLAVGFWIGRIGRRAKEPAVATGMGEVSLLLEQAPFGVLLLEAARNCRYANPYACRLLGLPSPNCLLPETAWSHLLDSDRHAVRQEKAGSGRYRSLALPTYSADAATQADRSDRFVRWWVTAFENSDLVFLEDVTSQERAEEAARNLINDLSHELRTPLATVLTHLEVLNLPGISKEISRQSMSLLKDETRRMSRLVNQLLELGRLETTTEIERRPVDLLAVVEETVTQLKPQAAARGIDLSTEVDTPLPILMGDRDRLRQVFLNLLDNAIKYSRPGDQVTVALKRANEGVQCTVSDNGPGIPTRHLPLLTRRFYRAAPQAVEGSGLGLALVEEILRRHHSELEIQSRTEGGNTGTRIQFLLPATDPIPEASKER